MVVVVLISDSKADRTTNIGDVVTAEMTVQCTPASGELPAVMTLYTLPVQFLHHAPVALRPAFTSV